jgi:hypothetical protein
MVLPSSYSMGSFIPRSGRAHRSHQVFFWSQDCSSGVRDINCRGMRIKVIRPSLCNTLYFTARHERLLSGPHLCNPTDRKWPTAPIRGPISSKHRYRATLDGPYARRHATPRPEPQEDAAGASGEATPKDSNTPQETLTIEASEPPNPEVNHE